MTAANSSAAVCRPPRGDPRTGEAALRAVLGFDWRADVGEYCGGLRALSIAEGGWWRSAVDAAAGLWGSSGERIGVPLTLEA